MLVLVTESNCIVPGGRINASTTANWTSLESKHKRNTIHRMKRHVDPGDISKCPFKIKSSYTYILTYSSSSKIQNSTDDDIIKTCQIHNLHYDNFKTHSKLFLELSQ